MSARPRQRMPAATGLPALVDEALSSTALERAAHTEDWPEQPPSASSPALPRAVWDRALGDVARDILGRPSRQFRARMCELGWRLGDGRGETPALLPALVEIVHAGSLIVDDIEDGSKLRRGAAAVHLVHGVPRTLNTGTWMYFWALGLVDRLPLQRATRQRIRDAVAEALHRGHLGQALDLSVSIGRMPRALVYRTVATSTMLKTGALMELAALAGALAAGASDDSIEALAQFGRRMGLGLQMLDDFGNLTAPTSEASEASEASDTKALEDLRNDRPTWPWAHAATDLDAGAFSQLQASARALREGGDPDGTRARALAAELRIAVGMKGRRQATAYLESALRDLRQRVGDRDELGLLASEIERLEVSYG
jgi:geranylgeranyl pyrophosphate synthase